MKHAINTIAYQNKNPHRFPYIDDIDFLDYQTRKYCIPGVPPIARMGDIMWRKSKSTTLTPVD